MDIFLNKKNTCLLLLLYKVLYFVLYFLKASKLCILKFGGPSKKRKNIDNSQPSKPTPMCNVEVLVEQPQCASVYKELTLISEQPFTRINIAHLIRDPSNRPQI